MAGTALFIGWGEVVPGREQQSFQVFGEGVAYWQRLQEQGDIERFEVVTLEPHGGDLAGFVLLHGERDTLSRLRYSEEFQRLNARAGFVIRHFGVVSALTGEEVNRLFMVYQEQAAELAP